MDSEYSIENMTCDDLALLKDFSLKFFIEYHYTKQFIKNLFAITLCQGAANHYAVCQGFARRYLENDKIGIKDIDIWFFMKKDIKKFNQRWLVSRDLGKTKFGKDPLEKKYIGRRVDFLGRSIDYNEQLTIERNIINWIRFGGGISPKYISEKAVIGLWPDEIFNKIIWLNQKLC
ncbi:MAG: hypothetical protein WHT07_07075 [Desulfobaccales bacterium]